MSKHFRLLFAVMVVLGLVLAACAPAATEAPAEKTKVAVLFPGVVTDDSWNQRGYEGLTKAETDCGVEGAYTEDVFQDEQLEVFRTYAAEGYDIIIGHGGEYHDAAVTVSKEYPDLTFIVSNGIEGSGNLGAFKISYSHMGYIAGAIAAEMTKTGKVALVLGEPIPIATQGEESFKAAVAASGKAVEVQTVVTGSWADVAKARESALALIADGVDVLWHVLDAADAGVFSAAEDQGVMAIGLYGNQQNLGPKSWIASAAGSPVTLIYEAACGRVKPGTATYMDVNTPNGVMPVYSDQIPQEVKDKVDGIVEKMRSGELQVAP